MKIKEVKTMNLNHLYYFYAMAEIGGVSKAAEFLNISQPSLSAQLIKFQKDIGADLFVKSGRCLELTAAGVVIHNYCEELFTITKLIENVISKER